MIAENELTKITNVLFENELLKIENKHLNEENKNLKFRLISCGILFSIIASIQIINHFFPNLIP